VLTDQFVAAISPGVIAAFNAHALGGCAVACTGRTYI
jgi:hypothetical protein